MASAAAATAGRSRRAIPLLRRPGLAPVLVILSALLRAAERDTWSDTWVATDALGRALPSWRDAGPPRPDRQVGIFYFLWLGAHVTGGPFDVSKVLARDPGAMEKKGSPLWGSLGGTHHWGEPLFGYHNSDDPWVLRKHARMLSNAGADAVIFDVTNQITYKPTSGAGQNPVAGCRERRGRKERLDRWEQGRSVEGGPLRSPRRPTAAGRGS